MLRTVQKSERSRVVPSSFPCRIPISSHAFRFEASFFFFFFNLIASCQTPKQTRRNEEKNLGGGDAIRKGGKRNP